MCWPQARFVFATPTEFVVFKQAFKVGSSSALSAVISVSELAARNVFASNGGVAFPWPFCSQIASSFFTMQLLQVRDCMFR